MAYLKINDVDILPFILQGGLEWTQNDVDSLKAGRTLDGMMHRGKVTTKVKTENSVHPDEALSQELASRITKIQKRNSMAK